MMIGVCGVGQMLLVVRCWLFASCLLFVVWVVVWVVVCCLLSNGCCVLCVMCSVLIVVC